MDHRQVEVTRDEGNRRVGEDVVEDDGAVEAEAGVALAEPEQRSRDREEDREGGGERCVQLLPGVEASLRRVCTAQPAPVVGVEDVQVARGGAEAPPVTEDEDCREGEDPRDGREEVDVLHQRPSADFRGERGKVEHEPGAEEHEERRCVHPVQRSLRAREAADVARPAHAAFDRPTQASRS
jgi:hypothetical protein